MPCDFFCSSNNFLVKSYSFDQIEHKDLLNHMNILLKFSRKSSNCFRNCYIISKKVNIWWGLDLWILKFMLNYWKYNKVLIYIWTY